jgi:CRISPR system Cascade subunit CasD
MQSWGTQSRFSIRDTGLEPSKSGVIGLLCAALGKPRREEPEDVESTQWPSLAQLRSLRIGVRVDEEGVLKVDYHTAGGTHRLDDPYGVAKADGSRPGTVTSERYYLSDANFLVGLEHDNQVLLELLDMALARPRWQLFLGRKSFVPGAPVRLADGMCETPLIEALKAYPWAGLRPRGEAPERLRLVMDTEPTGGSREVRCDVPLSFAERRFTIRYVETRYIDRPKGAA